VQLQIQKDRVAARHQRLQSRRAGCDEQLEPTLNQRQVFSNWLTSRAADPASGTSRATIRRLRASSTRFVTGARAVAKLD